MSARAHRGEWCVSDVFGDEWRISVAPDHEQAVPHAAVDWEERGQLDRLVMDGFTHSGATDDGIAGILLEIYDELTNGDLSTRLPMPTQDPQGLLCGLDLVLLETFLRALTLGALRIDPIARAPFSFADGPDEPVSAPDVADVNERVTWIGLLLVDQTGRPVRNRAYRVIFPDGSIQDGALDGKGSAMLSGTVPGSCRVSCPYVEPHPKLVYEIQQGDHISGIAERFGFDDYTIVSSDPGNAGLRKQRPDLHVLLPGDSLAIPELKPHAVDKPTGATHTFTLLRSPLKLRLKMLDLAAVPIVGASVTVNGTEFTTDGTGLVETIVNKAERSVQLLQSDAASALSVGAINPFDDTSEAGYKARLFNLGFLWDPTTDDGDDEMVIALQDFQAHCQLPVTGKLDDATKSQLAETHGC
jgi:hypothetical protein